MKYEKKVLVIRAILMIFLSIFFLTRCTSNGKNNSNPSNNNGTDEVVYENTSRSGNIDSDERWKGTIDITGDITIQDSGKLTIEPGTIVKFAAGSDDQNGGSTEPITDPPFPNDPAIAHSQISSINVFDGTLYAVGTVDEPIIFTSSAENPKWGDWDSIQYNSKDGNVILQNTIIEYGYYGVSINAADDDSSITISDNIIRHIVACGICGLCGSCGGVDEPVTVIEITISGNDVSYCGHEGIATFPGNNFIIENNIFHDNIESYGDGPWAVSINIDGNTSIIRNNQFMQNHLGVNILSKNSQPDILDNLFENNEVAIANYEGSPFNASGNIFDDNGKDCDGDCPSL